MKSIFNYDNLFFRVTGTLWDLIVLNLLWVMCCLPVITAGASTLALYTMINEMQEGTDGYLYRGFFKAFRKNLKKGFMTELLLLLSAGVILMNVFFWGQITEGPGKVCYIISLTAMCFYLLTVLYIFQMQIFTSKRILWTFGAAFFAAAQNFGRTIMLLALIISMAVLAFYFNAAALILMGIGASGLCYMALFLTKGIFKN